MTGWSKILNLTANSVRNNYQIVCVKANFYSMQILTKQMVPNKSLILTQIRSSHDRKLPIGPGKFNSKIVFDAFVSWNNLEISNQICTWVLIQQDTKIPVYLVSF
jgi:hypothetical protein